MVATVSPSPFSLTPDPSLMYKTPAINTVIFKTCYVIEQRQGLTCILGDVGLGKSTVLRAIHSRFLASADCSTAFLPSPSYPSDFALLKAICAEFGLPPRRSRIFQEDALKRYLLDLNEQGKTAAVFIDEAQLLPGKQMELIRVMLNLETPKQKLIQVVLAAQRELENKLRDPSKRAIRSRIFLPSFLSPLSLPEAAAMLEFRCQESFVPNPFNEEGVKAIYDASQGVPRDILKIAAAAYGLMKAMGLSTVPADEIPAIAKEAMLND